MTKVILGIHAQYRQIDIPFQKKNSGDGKFRETRSSNVYPSQFTKRLKH